MKAEEKVAWQSVLLILLGAPLIALVIAILLVPEIDRGSVAVLSWMVISWTALYLLILSWRLAYLAGQKN